MTSFLSSATSRRWARPSHDGTVLVNEYGRQLTPWTRLIRAGVAVGAFDSRPTVGARVAYERGDDTFECEIPVSETAGDTIDDVQEIGWQFESVEYEEDDTVESGWVGQYEFRRVEREPQFITHAIAARS